MDKPIEPLDEKIYLYFGSRRPVDDEKRIYPDNNIFWKDSDMAYNWTILNCILGEWKYSKMLRESNLKAPEWSHSEKKIICSKQTYDLINRYLIHNVIYGYIYDVTLNPEDIKLGNNMMKGQYSVKLNKIIPGNMFQFIIGPNVIKTCCILEPEEKKVSKMSFEQVMEESFHLGKRACVVFGESPYHVYKDIKTALKAYIKSITPEGLTAIPKEEYDKKVRIVTSHFLDEKKKVTLEELDGVLVNDTKRTLKDWMASYKISEFDFSNDNEVVEESGLKSKLDSNHKQKNHISLSGFKKCKLSQDIIDKYKNEYKYLNHYRVDKNNEGYCYIDNSDKIACVINVEHKDNGEDWIQGLEISENYKSHGLSEQLLDIATNDLKANYLSVSKDNEIAINLYKKYGFEIYSKTDKMYFMKLKSSEVKESGKLDAATDLYGKDQEKNIRRMDLLQEQFKRGKITKEEFDSKVAKIKSDSNNDDDNPFPIHGSKSFEPKSYTRPKDSKQSQDLSNLKSGNENSHGNVDDNTLEKIDRHYHICLTTEDFNEYQQHRRELCKLLKCPQDSVIKLTLQKSRKNFNCTMLKDDVPANLSSDTVLYHTTTAKNLNRLNGTFRSKDGVFYPTRRVYFYANKAGSRLGGSSANSSDNVYQYTGDISKAKIDQELRGGRAVYIETNTSVPVKEVKNEPVKESTLLESTSKSVVDTNHKQKGKKSLSEFKKNNITKEFVADNKNKYPFLKYYERDDYKFTEYLYTDDSDKAVCRVAVQKYLDNGEGWICNLDVFEPYKGYGLSKQLLDIAVKKLDGNYLAVSKDNELAINIYKKYGFKESKAYDSTKKMIYLTTKSEEVEESTMTSKERNELKDSIFGIPEIRKYPLDTKEHVLSAIRFFNYVDKKYEKELAENIIEKMVDYKISSEHVGKKNRLLSYIEKETDESVLNVVTNNYSRELSIATQFLNKYTMAFRNAVSLENGIYGSLQSTTEEKTAIKMLKNSSDKLEGLIDLMKLDSPLYRDAMNTLILHKTNSYVMGYKSNLLIQANNLNVIRKNMSILSSRIESRMGMLGDSDAECDIASHLTTLYKHVNLYLELETRVYKKLVSLLDLKFEE